MTTSAALAPHSLTVGDRTRPLEVTGPPRFSWRLAAASGQVAYQIRVRPWPAGTDGVWDSGRVPGPEQEYRRYAGPPLRPGATYRWQVRVWDAAGAVSPWAEPAEFDAGLGDEDWRASWIRRGPAGPVEEDEQTLARTTVTPGPSPVTRARLYLAAFHQYEARIDGAVVDRGPAFAYPGEGYYQATDVTGRFRAGRPAVLGVRTHWYGAGQGRPAAEPGLLVRLVIDHADGSSDVVVSDERWRVRRGGWYPGPLRNGEGDRVECFDARQDPLGWDRDPAFDDSGWRPAYLVGAHPDPAFGSLTGQEPRLAFAEVAPVEARRLSSGAVVADFGRVVTAVPVVRFDDGTPGRAVGLRGGYLLDADGQVSTTRGTQKTDMSFRYLQRAGEQCFRAATYLGFRYLQVDDPGARVTAVAQHTEVDRDRAATLESSDPALDRAFALLRDSALGCTQHQFLDTPTREKGQFLSDAVNESAATMRLFGERCVTRKAIREFNASQRRYWPDGRLNAVYPNGDGRRDIPDFTAMYPGWLWDYYWLSGDSDLVAESAGVARAVAGYLLRHVDRATGLVTRLSGGGGTYLHGLVDWPRSMRYGYDLDTAARTSVNLLALDALRATARIVRLVGRAEEAAPYAAAAAALRDAVNERLRRADGVYVDGLYDDGAGSTHASQLANAYALAFGAVPDGDRAAVARYVADAGLRMGPMTVRRLVEALCLGGRATAALRLFTDPDAGAWATTLARGGTLTWESWDARDNGQSESHGWGAGAAAPLVEHLVGVRAAAPAAARLSIQPPPAELSSLRARLPFPRGEVVVAWTRQADGATVEVALPPGMTAEVLLPGAADRPHEVGAGRTRLGAPALER